MLIRSLGIWNTVLMFASLVEEWVWLSSEPGLWRTFRRVNWHQEFAEGFLTYETLQLVVPKWCCSQAIGHQSEEGFLHLYTGPFEHSLYMETVGRLADADKFADKCILKAILIGYADAHLNFNHSQRCICGALFFFFAHLQCGVKDDELGACRNGIIAGVSHHELGVDGDVRIGACRERREGSILPRGSRPVSGALIPPP